MAKKKFQEELNKRNGNNQEPKDFTDYEDVTPKDN